MLPVKNTEMGVGKFCTVSAITKDSEPWELPDLILKGK